MLMIWLRRYTIESPHDNTYGVRLADGSWSGMIGLLANSVSRASAGLGAKVWRARSLF